MQEFNYTLVANLNHAAASDAQNALNLHESLVIQDSDISYYRRLNLTPDTNGRLSLIENLHRKLALVQAVHLQPHPDKPGLLQVGIIGTLSREGLTLDVPQIRRQGLEFSILVTEILDTGDLEGRGSSDFNITVPLDICGLDSGSYLVSVNSIERRFTLVD